MKTNKLPDYQIESLMDISDFNNLTNIIKEKIETVEGASKKRLQYASHSHAFNPINKTWSAIIIFVNKSH